MGICAAMLPGWAALRHIHFMDGNLETDGQQSESGDRGNCFVGKRFVEILFDAAV
jgi:hypothetical protein